MLHPDLIDALVDDLADTLTESEAIDIVARTVDALVPMDRLVPGPVGVFLERHDGDAVLAIGDWIRDIVTDPERRRAREARREWIRERAKQHRDAGHASPKARRLARQDWRAQR